MIMDDLFTPDQESQNIVSDNNGRFSIRRGTFSRRTTANKRNLSFIEILEENGGLPKQDECLFIKSTGTSDTGSLFNAMCSTGVVEEMYLSTWIISRTNIDFLCEQIDKGNIKKLCFIISVRQKQLKKANYAHMIEEFSKRPSIQFRVCNSHAKTFSCKINHNYYTATGSGNWTQNPRIENYILMNSKDAFDHNKDWMQELL